MPNVLSVLETALYVDDLKKSKQFYQTIFGFNPLEDSERLVGLSVADRQVLLLFKKGGSVEPIESSGGTIPPNDGSGQLHLAFSISASEWEGWHEWLTENNVDIESEVAWERGGQSLYFRDPDDHLIELVTPGCWAIY